MVDAPNGVGAPRGLDPAVAAKLRDAFRAAVASAEFKQACEKIDAPLLYLDGPDYEKYVLQTFKKETELIRRLNLQSAFEVLIVHTCSFGQSRRPGRA